MNFVNFLESRLTVGAVMLQTSSEVTKRLHHIILLLSKVMTSKSDFLLIGDEIIKAKGSMNTKHFVKPSLFVEYDYEHQTSTLLWTAGVNK